MAGLPLNRPSVRVSATLSATTATSESRTGALLRQATISLGIVGGVAAGGGGVDLEPAAVALDRTLGPVGVGGLDRGAHVLETDAVVVQLERIDLDPHGRQGAAADLDLADAVDLGDALGDGVGHRVIDLARRLRRRGQGQDDDRRAGRIDLVIGRVAAQRGGQVGARRIDRRLNLARGAVDVAVQVELQLIRVEPDELDEVISLTSEITPNRRSSGVATLEAMVSGLAPDRLARTEIAG
jgi:hypothetical protein